MAVITGTLGAIIGLLLIIFPGVFSRFYRGIYQDKSELIVRIIGISILIISLVLLFFGTEQINF
jgi:uncharacterized membrane protein YbhN (UPF0104 family)